MVFVVEGILEALQEQGVLITVRDTFIDEGLSEDQGCHRRELLQAVLASTRGPASYRDFCLPEVKGSRGPRKVSSSDTAHGLPDTVRS